MVKTPSQESIVQFVVDDFASKFVSLTGFLLPDEAFADVFKDADTEIMDGIETYEKPGEELPHKTSAFIFFPDLNITVCAIMHRKRDSDATGKITVSAVYGGKNDVFLPVETERTFEPTILLD